MERSSKKNNISAAIFAIVFLVILILPLLFSFLSVISGLAFDVPLLGNFLNTPVSPISKDTVISGEFQRSVENKWNDNFRPRGIAIKTYNQLRYTLFHEGNRIVGTDGSIFEPLYIQTDLALAPDYDCSSAEKRNQVELYVKRLNHVCDLLNKHGKRLIVYTTPNKASYYRQSIPYSFMSQISEGSVSYINYFRELYRGGEFVFPYLDSYMELPSDNSFPIFYKTGIHWSRPAEQIISQKLLEMISFDMDETVPQIELGELNISDTPYWRDADVYDLLNIWSGKKDDFYYEYSEKAVEFEQESLLNVFLIGGSFANGFERAIATLSLGNVDYLNYGYGTGYRYLRRNFDDNTITWINAMSDLDLQSLLDKNNVIVLEINESVLVEKTSTDLFLDKLEAFCEEYVPGVNTISEISFPLQPGVNLSALNGFYWAENNCIWSKQSSKIILKNELFDSNGLELRIFIPNEIPGTPNDKIRISVNGNIFCDISLSEKGEHTIIIPATELNGENGVNEIAFSSDESFCPADYGALDDRILSFALLYAGPRSR